MFAEDFHTGDIWKLIRHGSESNLCPILITGFNQSEGSYDPFIQYFILRLYIKSMSINRTFVRHKSAGGTSLPKKTQGLHLVDDLFLVIAWSCIVIAWSYRYWSDLQARYRDDVAGNATVAETIAVGRSVLIVLAQETDWFCITCGYIADKSALWFCLPAAVIAWSCHCMKLYKVVVVVGLYSILT